MAVYGLFTLRSIREPEGHNFSSFLDTQYKIARTSRDSRNLSSANTEARALLMCPFVLV